MMLLCCLQFNSQSLQTKPLAHNFQIQADAFLKPQTEQLNRDPDHAATSNDSI